MNLKNIIGVLTERRDTLEIRYKELLVDDFCRSKNTQAVMRCETKRDICIIELVLYLSKMLANEKICIESPDAELGVRFLAKKDLLDIEENYN